MYRATVFLLAAVALCLTGCHKPWVYVGYDHAAAPGMHATYSWGLVRVAVRQYQAPIEAAVEKNLASRGWQLVPSGGSATVFVLGDIKNAEQLEAVYKNFDHGWAPPEWSAHGRGRGWKKSAYGEVDSVVLGNPGNKLIIDIFDSSTHQLLLRAVAENELSNTEKKNVKLLDKTIHKMLKKLPK